MFLRKRFCDGYFIILVRAKPLHVGFEMCHQLSCPLEGFCEIEVLDFCGEFKPVAMSELIPDGVTIFVDAFTNTQADSR